MGSGWFNLVLTLCAVRGFGIKRKIRNKGLFVSVIADSIYWL